MDETAKRVYLWEWTQKHIKNKIPFNEWLPSESELTELGVRLKLSVHQQNENKALLQSFLADEKYCKACAECGYKSTCYLNGKRATLLVVDGDVNIGTRECQNFVRF